MLAPELDLFTMSTNPVQKTTLMENKTPPASRYGTTSLTPKVDDSARGRQFSGMSWQFGRTAEHNEYMNWHKRF